jgi:penicillin-binding protein 1C
VQNRPAYAWKTGTSYGFRDAWALAVSNAVTVGVWIGRPDGTPSPGQYGSATAAPLLLQVLEILDIPADELPRPANVTEAATCWPTGWTRDRNEQLGLACHRQHSTWILDNQVPPTLRDPLAPLSGVVQTVLVNPENGRRVDQSCTSPGAHPLDIALWPKRAEPWLPPKWRWDHLIPPPDDGCPHMPALAGTDIKINGVSPESILTATSINAALPTIALKALGGIGRRFWYLNGRSIAVTENRQVANYAIPQPGQYQLAVVDEAGNTDKVVFEVMARF